MLACAPRVPYTIKTGDQMYERGEYAAVRSWATVAMTWRVEEGSDAITVVLRDGDVLVVTTRWQNGQSWLDRAGNFASEHPSSVAVDQVFKKEVARLTNNQLQVDVFPAMQLGGAKENVDAVRSGTLAITRLMCAPSL